MGWMCALGGLLGLWVVMLRRQVGHLNQAVRQQLERQVALDERYADLVSSVTDAVFALDLNGRFTAVNAASESLSGYSRAEILRGSLVDLIVPESRDEARRRLAHAAANAGRGDMRLETTIAAKEGRLVHLSGQLRLITLRGLAIGFEGVAHPVQAPASTDRSAPRATDPERQLVA